MSQAIDGQVPLAMRPRRSLVLIGDVQGDRVKAFVPQWREDEAVEFSLSLVPEHMRGYIVPDGFVLADINTDAERAEDLFFTNFEPTP